MSSSQIPKSPVDETREEGKKESSMLFILSPALAHTVVELTSQAAPIAAALSKQYKSVHID